MITDIEIKINDNELVTTYSIDWTNVISGDSGAIYAFADAVAKVINTLNMNPNIVIDAIKDSTNYTED